MYYGGTIADAVMCRNEDVYIVGGANAAGQAAMHFSRYARTVTMLVRGDSLSKSMSHYLMEQIQATGNLRVRLNTTVVEVHGQNRLEAITIRDAAGMTETIPTNALFLFIGARPPTEWLEGVVQRDHQGFIVTGPDLQPRPSGWSLNRRPFPLESSVPGIFAAGDVRHGSVKRVAAGMGEGATAVQCIHTYMESPASGRPSSSMETGATETFSKEAAMTSRLRIPTVFVVALAAVLALASWSARAGSAPEGYTAFAVDMGFPGRTTAGPVEFVIERYSSDEERDRLMKVLVDKGPDKLLDTLQSLPRVGYFRTPNSIGYDIKFAHKHKGEDGGDVVTMMTDRYIGFWEAANRPRTIDYPFTLIEIRIGPAGEGRRQDVPRDEGHGPQEEQHHRSGGLQVAAGDPQRSEQRDLALKTRALGAIIACPRWSPDRPRVASFKSHLSTQVLLQIRPLVSPLCDSKSHGGGPRVICEWHFRCSPWAKRPTQF